MNHGLTLGSWDQSGRTVLSAAGPARRSDPRRSKVSGILHRSSAAPLLRECCEGRTRWSHECAQAWPILGDRL